MRLERRLGGGRARQQAPAQPRVAAEVFGVEQPELGSVLPGVRGPGEQRRETRERAQQDLLPGADVVVGAKTGPGLFGVVDRPKGTFPNFAYSAGLKAKGGDWTFEDLNTFLTAPKAFISDTKMGYAGEKDPHKRADILAYLDTLSDNPVPLPKP